MFKFIHLIHFIISLELYNKAREEGMGMGETGVVVFELNAIP